MATTAVFLTEDSIDILELILDSHEHMLITERASVMPPLALASALNDVEAIRTAIAHRVRES